jgi:signal transduction histidine kinase/ABC-type amino acid transport substrate-binding protein/FixJ family two-component response regulator
MSKKSFLQFIFILLTAGTAAAYAQDTQVLVIALRNDLPPLSFLSDQGRPSGLFVDMWNLWAKKTGQKISFHMVQWNETIESLKNGTADIHGALYYSKDRSEWMAFSEPLYEFGMSVFFSKNHGKISNIRELAGVKTGISSSTAQLQDLRKNYPDIRFVEFAGIEDMIHAAHDGKITAFISMPLSVLSVLNRLGLAGEFESTNERLFVRKLHAGILKHRTELLALINSGFDAVSNKELSQLEARWIPDPAERYFNPKISQIKLTAAEKLWIQHHPSVRFGITATFPPFSFTDNNNVPAGMVSDYLEILRNYTGISLQITAARTNQEIFSLLKSKAIDGIPFTLRTPEREEFMNITKPYITKYWVAVTRDNYPFVGGLEDLAGKKVGVLRNSAAWEILKEHPSVKLVPANTQRDLWKSVSLGKTDAVVQNIASAGYFISQLGISNLKVAYTFPKKLEAGLGIRKDLPELFSTLNKAIDMITPEEHAEIQRKWLALRYEQGVDWRTVRWWAGIILGIFLSALTTALIWNRRLAKEIMRRIETEALLREREELFRSMFENHQAVMLLISPETGKIIRANRAAHKFYGYSAQEFENMTIYLLASQRIRDVEVHSSPILLKGKTILFSIIHDISDRRRAEEALRRSESLLNQIQHISKTGGWEYDLISHQCYWTEETYRIYEVPSDFDIRDIPHPLTLYSPENQKTIEQCFGRACEIGEPYDLELDFTGARGSRKWVRITAQAEKVSGKVVRVVGNLMDITESRKTQDELRKAKAVAEAASRAKSEFLANMSHEIRTPMNAVLGFTDVLLSIVTDGTRRNYLQKIKSAGKGLLTLINDILDLSRIESGTLAIHRQPVSIRHLFAEIRDVFSLQLTEKDISFKIDIAEDLPEFLLLDEVRLRQILLNLVGNAVKFTESGYVRLFARYESSLPLAKGAGGISDAPPLTKGAGGISDAPPLTKGAGGISDANPPRPPFAKGGRSLQSGTAVITVEDTGIGIPREYHERIFEPFCQAEEEDASRKYGGTGLGLAITRRLTEMMGGQISLVSDPGKGSLFEIILHNVAENETLSGFAEGRIPDFQTLRFKPATVLVIDDLKVSRELLKAYLKNKNLTFFEAESGEQGVAIAKAQHPDIIITDIRMPGMDGFETAEKIRQHSELRHIPLIAYTTLSMKSEQEEIMTRGFDGYVGKPLQKPDLIQELKKFIPVWDAKAPAEEEPVSEVFSGDMKQLSEITEKLTPVWEKARNIPVTRNIRQFAEQIQNIGETGGIRLFADYGKKLMTAAQQYDIEKMESLMKAYPEVVKKLQAPGI